MMRRYEITIKATVDEAALANDVAIEYAVANYVGAILEDIFKAGYIRSIKARRESK